MNRNRKSTRTRPQPRRVWSHKQALSAVPYLTGVMRSIREHQMDYRKHQLTADRLSALPGRPNRDTLIAQEETRRAAQRAQESLQEALGEVDALDVVCEAPLQGVALIPFLHDDRPAWFIFSLFDDEPIQHWRYNSDASAMRRPVDELGRISDEATWLG